MKQVLIAAAWVLATAAGAIAASPVEVAISVPLETNLAVPGVRSIQEVWLEMISEAKRSIDLEQFYVDSKPGEALDPVLAALRAAAARGVRIRLLLDSKFLKTYHSDPEALSQVSGIQVKSIDFSQLGGIQHAKYFIVDQSSSFIGSANFDWLALSHIHEVGLRVTDTQVSAQAESIFEKDWASGDARAPQVSVAGSSGIQVVASPLASNPAGIPDTLSSLVGLIGKAQQSLKIQVYEYNTKVYHGVAPWKELDTAIRRAAAKGVHVQLLVDAVALKAGRADLKSLSAVHGIEVRIVTIPQWSGGVIPFSRLIHSKYFVIDRSSGWVGSENWSESYFTSTRNVGVTFERPEVAGTITEVFDQVWSSGYAAAL